MVDVPPGFRFYPTEEELVSFYLHNKLHGKGPLHQIDLVIPVVDIYDYNPQDLAQFAGAACGGDPEQWFFFVPVQEEEARGGRPKRLTEEGYWKSTGSPGYVYSSDNRVIGTKRTMVFYRGRAPTGKKTEWKMNEYGAIPHASSSSSSTGDAHHPSELRQELKLCRVYIKSKCVRSFDRRPSGMETVEVGKSADTSSSSPPPGDIAASTSSTTPGNAQGDDDWDGAQMFAPNNSAFWDDSYAQLDLLG